MATKQTHKRSDWSRTAPACRVPSHRIRFIVTDDWEKVTCDRCLAQREIPEGINVGDKIKTWLGETGEIIAITTDHGFKPIKALVNGREAFYHLDQFEKISA